MTNAAPHPATTQKRAALAAAGFSPAPNHPAIQIRKSYAPPAMGGRRG